MKYGGGRFVAFTLKRRVLISSDSDAALANAPYHKANEFCFIAESVNFPVRIEAAISAEQFSASD